MNKYYFFVVVVCGVEIVEKRNFPYRKRAFEMYKTGKKPEKKKKKSGKKRENERKNGEKRVQRREKVDPQFFPQRENLGKREKKKKKKRKEDVFRSKNGKSFR